MGKVTVGPLVTAKVRASIDGALARDMLKRGIRVESAAKKRISHSPRRIDTGRLRASITALPMRKGKLPGSKVGSGVEYAFYVHEGTRHMIGNPYLRDALPAART